MIPPLLPAYLVAVTAGLSIACLITLFSPQLSIWIPALTTYGKASLEICEQPFFLRAIAVPKRWFTHFYIIAVLNVAVWLIVGYLISVNAVHPPSSMIYLLDLLTPKSPQIPFTTALIALFLMFFHVLRRCYESLFISVFSDSHMNVGHYVMGIAHYLILPLTVVCESHGFIDGENSRSPLSFSMYQFIGLVLFFICNFNQHFVVKKMAQVRKTPDGLTSHYNHGIFYGYWFNKVSCPHFMFEVGIYLSLGLILTQGYVYYFMLMFVIVNQTFAAKITHKWYKKTFPKYPKNRCAIFPYII